MKRQRNGAALAGALAACVGAAFFFAVHAGEESPLNPAEQPLAVVRLARPGAAAAMRSTRQMRATPLAGRDYSGPIPGLGGRAPSLNAFLANLDAKGAENLWLCLFTRGGTLFNLAAVFGFDQPVGKNDAAVPAPLDWLRDAGFSGSGLAVRELAPPPGRRRFALARDDAALREGLDGTGEAEGRGAGGGWRNDLRRFMLGKSSGVGVWINPRPLAGALSLLTGVDPRAIVRETGLDMPESLEVEFLPAGEDLGFEVRLNRLFPKETAKSAGPLPILGPRREGTLAEIHVAAPWTLLRLFGLDGGNPLFAANMDLSPLIPRTMRLAVWRGEGGKPSWSLTCLLESGSPTRKQMGRLRAWLDFLAAAPGPIEGFRVTRYETRGRDELWRVSFGRFSCVLGLAERGEDAFLFAAGEARDCPDVRAVRIEMREDAKPIWWDLRPDAAMLDDAAKLLMRSVDGLTPKAAAAVLANDAGGLWLERRSLAVSSRTGAAPFLFAALADMLLRAQVDKDDIQLSEKAVDRLHFLLAVANQSRFRRLAPGRFQPDPLPSDLGALAFAGDPAGREWVERTFPELPGFFSAPEALDYLTRGEAVDGYAYAIREEDGEWRITAVDEAGGGFAVDAEGTVEAITGSGASL